MPDTASRHGLIERCFERTIFSSRWLLAPIYVGLAISLAVLLVKFVQYTVKLVLGAWDSDSSTLIVGILSLIDLSLMANLVLMVMYAGYENFVSRFDLVDSRDKPDWMGHVGFGDLKLKLMASIVAISAISVLESFMNLENLKDRDLAWTIGIHMAFVVSAVLLALMDRITGHAAPPKSPE